MSITAPDPEHGLRLPEKGEPMRIVGDISQVNDDARVQKALRRLAAEKAPTSLSQLVMWNLAAGLDWSTIARALARLVEPQRADLGERVRGPAGHAGRG